MRILALNLFLRPPGVCNNGDDFKDERLDDFLALISSYDVVCLEEVFSLGTNRPRRLIKAAQELGFKYSARPRQPLFFLVDSGLVILSKKRILLSDAVVLPRGTIKGADALASKSVLYALIEGTDGTPSSRFHLFSTHLQATYPEVGCPVPERYVAIRKQQLACLSAFVQSKRRGNDLPVILAGDFNINSRAHHEHSPTACPPPPAGDHPQEPARAAAAPGESREYLDLLRAVDPAGHVRDLLKEDNGGQHPVTFGDAVQARPAPLRPVPPRRPVPPARGARSRASQDYPGGPLLPRETALTHEDDLVTMQSIDYIFYIPPLCELVPGLDAAHRHAHVRPVAGTARVEPFFVARRPYSQLSDHYGVECTFALTAPPPLAAPPRALKAPALELDITDVPSASPPPAPGAPLPPAAASAAPGPPAGEQEAAHANARHVHRPTFVFADSLEALHAAMQGTELPAHDKPRAPAAAPAGPRRPSLLAAPAAT
eukprot:tig00021293_g19999.t1